MTPSCSNRACLQTTATILGAYCANSGVCTRLKCKKDLDCGSSKCFMDGKDCLQETNYCRTGACQASLGRYPGQVCNTKTGICSRKRCRSIPECGSKRCIQDGLSCTEFAPMCRNTGNYQNSACFSTKRVYSNRTCKSGSCQKKACSNAGHCGKVVCKNVEGSCVESTPVCASRVCQASQKVFVGRACNTATGRCMQRCNTPSDCGSNYCKKEALRDCREVTRTCVGGVCGTTSKYFRIKSCQASTGKCR